MSKLPFEIRETLEESWHGHRLVMEPMTGRKALSASYRLGKYIGPALGKLTTQAQKAPAKKKGASVLDIDVDFESVLSQFFDNCTEDEFTSFADLMLHTCRVNNVELDMNSNHFLGYPERIMEILIKAVMYQFQGFFSAFKNKMPNLGQ